MQDSTAWRRPERGPKVGHKKSRNGCRKCKGRRVKASWAPASDLRLRAGWSLGSLAAMHADHDLPISATRGDLSAGTATASTSTVLGQTVRLCQPDRNLLLLLRSPVYPASLNRNQASSPMTAVAPPIWGIPYRHRRRSLGDRRLQVSSFSPVSTTPRMQSSQSRGNVGCWNTD